MPKFGIFWDVLDGYYDCEMIEAENKEAAQKIASERWHKVQKDHAHHGAVEAPEGAESIEYNYNGPVFYDDEGDEIDDDDNVQE